MYNGRMETDNRKTFGEIALEKGFISQETLDAALQKQKSLQDQGRYPLLGIVLLRMGVITGSQLIEIIIEMEN